MTEVPLLDVNVLVALFDPDHVHHEAAHAWFAPHRQSGWATCPLTENGCVRVLSNPTYREDAERVLQVVNRLRTFCDSGGHMFWEDTLSLRNGELFRFDLLAGHQQLTDIYLLGLAVEHRGRLATFDRRIPVAAVKGATAGTVLLIPVVDPTP